MAGGIGLEGRIGDRGAFGVRGFPASCMTFVCGLIPYQSFQVIVLTTTDAAAVRATRESLRVLRDLVGVPHDRVRFVQNQPRPYGNLTGEDVAELIGTREVVEVPFGGEEVSKAGLNGFPLVMSRSGNPASRAIVGLARELDQSGRELLALAR